ncbi:MAG TPA: choice-of-anchor tandem repeat GloVer-containing protein [Alphaproteobacteria bacterium]|nr:choice-of-anchor tandem repeat GloVer-containing protein [Alphaproteobacteria bacterium]
MGALIGDGHGNLYGTTSAGGSSKCTGGCGVVFKLSWPPTPGGAWTETVLHTFQGGTGGRTPLSGLIFDADGALYGTTAQGGGSTQCTNGCGTVFKLTPPPAGGTKWTMTILHRFSGLYGAVAPLGGVVMDSAGALYGTTGRYPAPVASTCLDGPCGTVYKLTPPAGGSGHWALQILHKFKGKTTDGSLPLGTLISDETGALFGVTGLGGSTHCFGFGCGTVFKLTPPTAGQTAWSERVIYAFQGGAGLGGTELGYPDSDLTADADGNLYGMANVGPAGGCTLGCGGVFKLTPPAVEPGTWTESVIYAFKGGTDGASPASGRLALAKTGAIYGTTQVGGSASDGTIFRLSPKASGAWPEAVVHSFTGDNTDGSAPQGGLVRLPSGYYGTTSKGGASNLGTVFRMSAGAGE